MAKLTEADLLAIKCVESGLLEDDQEEQQRLFSELCRLVGTKAQAQKMLRKVKRHVLKNCTSIDNQ